MALFLTQPETDFKNIKFDIDLDWLSQACLYRQDWASFLRILLTLMENAMDASESSSTVSIYCNVTKTQNFGGSKVCVVVRDQGIGVNQSIMRWLAEPLSLPENQLLLP